jgi:hypothetical protein
MIRHKRNIYRSRSFVATANANGNRLSVEIIVIIGVAGVAVVGVVVAALVFCRRKRRQGWEPVHTPPADDSLAADTL